MRQSISPNMRDSKTHFYNSVVYGVYSYFKVFGEGVFSAVLD